MRVAVTGAGGRLGRALIEALESAPFTGLSGPIGWTRQDFDLDAPESIERLLDRDRPEVIVHAAAWTDVDGCARDPDLAMKRNANAVRVVAAATARRAADLVLVSTNEVFDGTRAHDRGYRPDDERSPTNAYGASKAAGEIAAVDAYAGAAGRSAIVRTSWLYGPPGNDFPTKILAAAESAAERGETLKVVGDEYGSPTSSHDLAEAIVELIGSDEPDVARGVHHVVNTGVASRASWAHELFGQLGLTVEVEEVPSAAWRRASTPPPWGVLEPTPLPSGEPLRPWQAALADYVPTLLRQRTAAR